MNDYIKYTILAYSLKELVSNYDIFLYFIIFVILFFAIFYILVWYYELADEYFELLEYYENTDNLPLINRTDLKSSFIFGSSKNNSVKLELPQDSDDENDLSISLSDLKYIEIKTTDINKKDQILKIPEEKINIIALKDIIKKDNIENINDLITLGKYYEDNLLETYMSLINKLYKYGDNYYTINLEKVYNIKGSLIKLKKMVGLTDIKNNIIDMLLYYLINYIPNENMMHMTLEGPPGCGKTKLAKIISQILNKMEILDSNKIVYAKSTDLIAEYVGQTGPKTQKVINSALGGILFIDEAYGLGSSSGKEYNFSSECINVLNQNLSDNKHQFICIIAGYSDELEDMFFSVNPGLKRRFPFKFIINGYTYQELMKIFMQKIYRLNWKINQTVDLETFFKDNYLQFKYFGGDIDTLIQNIKYAHSRRIICDGTQEGILIMGDLSNALYKLKSTRKEEPIISSNKTKLYNLMKKFTKGIA